jgi:glutathione S-transferase
LQEILFYYVLFLDMPFGKVPALEVDGKLVGQSNAIARYLASKHGLAGKNEWEALQIDSLVDALGDFKACKFT